MTVSGFVLAAGSSRRFGERAKLLADFRGRPLFEWAVDAALGAGLDHVAVVWGPVDLRDRLPPGVEAVENPRHAEGLATSLAVAIDVARRRGDAAVVVGLADQPLVVSEAWRRVAASTAPVAVATYEGRRRNPVKLGREVWDALPTSGDEGARAVMDRYESVVEPIPCPGDPVDVDTEEDLARWS